MRPTTRAGFGPWLPDLPALDNPGLVEALNALPIDGVYKPFLPLTSASDAFSSRIQGAYAASDADGNTRIYAGDASTLKELSGTSWIDRSQSGGYTTQDTQYWNWAQYDEKVIATNFADPIQTIDLGGAQFGDLSANAPRCRHLGIVRGILMAGDTSDATNGHVPYRVQWSAIGDPTDWPTPGSLDAISKQAGAENMNPSYGKVMGISDGEEFCIVMQERALTRFVYVGGNTVFQVQTYEYIRGVYSPRSWVQIGSRVFYLSADGFYTTNGSTVEPIGNGKVDKFFLDDLNTNYINRITAAVDPNNKLILWSYPSTASTSGEPDSVLIYNYEEGRWSHAEQAAQLIFSSKTTGYTLDQLDSVSASLDDLSPSLDSSFWTGGNPSLGGITADNKYAVFGGSALDATFVTGEKSMNPGGRTMVDGVKPLITGNPTVTVEVGSREDQSDAVTWSTAVTANSRTGIANFRVDDFYHRARIVASGGFTQAIGYEMHAKSRGYV